MKTCVFFLIIISVTSFLSLTEALTKPSGIKLVDNQYTGIVVAIHEDEPENSALIESIKSMFVGASSYLYNATKKRAFFKEVTILVPSTWSDDPSYGTVRNESFRDADVIIASPNPRFSPKEDLPPPPYTKHYGGCGKQGVHIHLTSRFLLDSSLEDIFGDFGRLLVHEWGHFRWGLFNEYPDSVEDNRYSDHFYLSSATDLYEPVACPRSWNMSAMKYTGIHARPLKRCNGNKREGYERGCLSVAEEIQPHFTASIMMNKHLSFEQKGNLDHVFLYTLQMNYIKRCYDSELVTDSQVIHFCDNDTEDQGTLHNSEANNKHNRLCGGRSSWEVMREHDDFRGDRNPPREIEDVRPSFKVIRENEAGKPIVLVLDTSGSMSSMNRSKRLQSVAKSFLISTVAHGCRVGIVDFDSSGKILSHLREINSETSRQELAGLIVGDHTGGTCIGCGVMEALKILPANETGKIILITDGRDSKIADLMAAQAECIRRGIVIDSIAYSDMAQAHLRVLSEGTGGKFYLQTDDPRSRGALQAYIENSDCGRQRTSSKRIPVFSNVFTLSVGDSEETGSLEIDPTIGRETKFIFAYFVSGNTIQVELTSPNGRRLDSLYTGYKQDLDSRIITVNILGIAEVGTWRFTITSRSVGSYDVTVFVSSLPTSERVPPIKIRSYLSGTEAEVTPQTPLVAIAEVRQGLYPILNARVIATVERPLTQSGHDLGSVEMTLRDDGIGSDVTKNDGLYTRTFTNFTGVGFYGVSVRAESGSETLILRPSARPGDAEFGNNVMAFWNETYTTNAPSIETTDGKVPNFNRECSAGASYVSRIPDGWTPESDIFPPSTILDLTVTSVDAGNAIVNISCTSPGGNMDSGKASYYVILRANSTNQLKHDCSSDAFAIADDDVMWGNLSLPSEFGTKEEFSIRVPTQEGQMVASFFLAIFAVDESGNRGKISNIVQTTLWNESFQAREESKDFHAPRTTEDVLLEAPSMTTGSQTTTKPLTPTKVTQDISHVTMVHVQNTTEKDSINDKLTNQMEQMTKSEGNMNVETTTTNIDSTKRPYTVWNISVTKNINATIRPDAIWKTETKTNTDSAKRHNADWKTGAKTKIGTTNTPGTTWKTDAKTKSNGRSTPDIDRTTGSKTKTDTKIRLDTHWKTGVKTNIEPTFRPDTNWKTEAKANSDSTMRPDTNWKSGARTNIDSTVTFESNWKTGSRTNIDATARPNTNWKTGVKMNIDATTSTPETNWKTGVKTNIDSNTRPDADWKTDAKTNIDATSTSDVDWQTGTRTNIDAMITTGTNWKTGVKTNIDHTIRSDTDLKTDAKTNIDTTMRLDSNWKTGSKTNIDATARPDTNWKTDVKMNIDATTSRPDTNWKTGVKTNIDSTTRPGKQWKTGAKTYIDTTSTSDVDWNTVAKTNIDATISPDTHWKTGVKTNIDATLGPDTHMKTGVKANVDNTIRPGTDWKTDAKGNIYPTIRPDPNWKTDGKKNIKATVRPDANWKTGAKTNIDSTITSDVEGMTDVKTHIDGTVRPDLEWNTGVNKNIEATIMLKTSVYDTMPLTDVFKEIGATMNPNVMTDGDTKTEYNAITAVDETVNRTLPPENAVTGIKNTTKIDCETKYGWKEFNRHCYKLLYLLDGGGHNFSTMLTACKEEGPSTFGKDVTRVADITSKAENDFVANTVAEGNRAWIGAKRVGNGGSFVWKIGDGNQDDPTIDAFTNWKQNEPNNKWNQELCVEINRGPDGGWNDIRCRRKLPIICKYSLSSLGK